MEIHGFQNGMEQLLFIIIMLLVTRVSKAVAEITRYLLPSAPYSLSTV